MQIESVLTCPHCTQRSTEIMPTNACQFFYDCKGCCISLKPRHAGFLLCEQLMNLPALVCVGYPEKQTSKPRWGEQGNRPSQQGTFSQAWISCFAPGAALRLRPMQDHSIDQDI